MPFYDHYLKGKKTSYETRAAGRMGRAQRRQASLGRNLAAAGAPRFAASISTAATAVRLTSLNDGTLKASADAVGGGSTSYSYPDPEWALGIATAGPGLPDPVRRILTFTSEPLDADHGDGRQRQAHPVRLDHRQRYRLHRPRLGAIAAIRRAARKAASSPLPSSSPRAGSGPRIAAAAIPRTAARSGRSIPMRSQEFLAPGEIYQIDIPLNQMGYLFKKGNRIRVEIANHDSPVTDKHFNHFYKPSKIGTDTIRHREGCHSYLALPVLREAG